MGELTRHIKDALRESPRLRDLWVEGEVGQVSVSSAGHCYFTLKDERAQVRCMIFRDDRMAIPFQPRTGVRLVAHGRVDVFEAQGVYQLYVDTLQPAGFGDLALRFEALKAQLTKEGLFDGSRKRPLPQWPRTIGICTSLSGAVLHDMRKVLARRWPSVRVLVSACQVQGPGAPESIVDALRRMARWTDATSGRAVDVVILARGGGSMEDLWAFNEEIVVRAVAAFPVPIVVGVGHETDVTLAEFAADVRAATPSVAAELCVPSATGPGRAAAGAAATAGRLRVALVDGGAWRAGRRAARPRCVPALGLSRRRAGTGGSAARPRDARHDGRASTSTGAGSSAWTTGCRWCSRDACRVPGPTSPEAPPRWAPSVRTGPSTGATRWCATRRAASCVTRQSLHVDDPLEVRLARGAVDVRVARVPDSVA